MTSRDLRRLPRLDLDELYASLRADRLPVGTYDGRTWPVSVWPLWRGKVFYGEWQGKEFWGGRWPGGCEAINRLGSGLIIHGDVYRQCSEVVIDYPQLHIQDYLKPVSDTLWLGYLKLGPFRIWFTLERKN